ncbi:MAG: methionyl-tRNA formyltransferase-like protein [Devosia sp.]|uniref:methionyl-tRNA formyltransferase-like protein n=1 Tax=Devosia sp. TaxID=1871048 RepID=UPI0024C505BF|nr:methionyl-tRNA formyltransferase-like protein [Devosia sp.]UYN98674.1 MAG: methionyl-tRNA formyltransferase-like protein [Devosia sp.]
MDQLTEIMEKATAAIEARFMQLPIYKSSPKYRERVYCYELYHQMRSRWPNPCAYTLNGEVDKRGHETLQALEADNTIPDLLVHIPGNWDGNHAIIEVKHADAQHGGIAKDLRTLDVFLKRVDYERAIYLFYGGLPETLIKAIAAEMPDIAPIEVWLHPEPGQPARKAFTLPG